MYDLAPFAQLSEAEDFLAFFEVAFDQRVLARHRVALLRAWAHSVAQIDKTLCGASAEKRLSRYGEALQELHGAFAAGDCSAARAGRANATGASMGERVPAGTLES